MRQPDSERNGSEEHPNSERVRPPIEQYLHEINQVERLTVEQERALAERIAAGDEEAKRELTEANLRLVVSVARGFQGRGLALEDLIQEGSKGLMRAVRGFKPVEFNAKFSTYATHWIKQAIKIGIINHRRTVRVPAYMVELISNARKILQEWDTELTLEIAVYDPQLMRDMGLQKSTRLLKKALAATATRSLDESPYGKNDERLRKDEIDTPTVEPSDVLDLQDDIDKMHVLLNDLDERDRTILELRFFEQLTLKEVGEIIGITRERVRQIEARTLMLLRERIQKNHHAA